MSSSVILSNGGRTAENFILGPALEGDQDPAGVNYDAWEPEDLVATVQFLATLDDRLQQQQQPVYNNNFDVQPDDRENDGKVILDAVNPTPTTMDASSEEVIEPPLSGSLQHGDVSAAPSVVALSDIATEENSVSSAAQTPCSVEERSIIRASNKPAHLKRYAPSHQLDGDRTSAIDESLPVLVRPC